MTPLSRTQLPDCERAGGASRQDVLLRRLRQVDRIVPVPVAIAGGPTTDEAPSRFSHLFATGSIEVPSA